MYVTFSLRNNELSKIAKGIANCEPIIIGDTIADLLKNNLVDEIHLFKAPITIGKKGIPVIKGNDLKNINKKLLETIKFDDNLYFKYEIK